MEPRIVHNQAGHRSENLYGACAALSIANCIGMSYEDMTKFAIKHLPVVRNKYDKQGNVHVAGVYAGFDSFLTGLRKLGRPVNRFYMYEDNKVTPKRVKLETMVKQLPKGRFLISVSGHMVAVVDNVICDNNYTERTCRNSIVKRVFEVGARNQELRKEIKLKKGVLIASNI